MKKAIAEFIGTFALVLIGCGTAVIAGMGTGATSVDVLGIATAFGLTIVAMAYGIGQVSGCHINLAVSFGALVAGRMSGSDFVSYVIALVLGAIAGAFVLYLILSGKASGWSGGLGQNGWGPGYLGEYNLTAAFLYDVIGTFLFLVCILGVNITGTSQPGAVARTGHCRLRQQSTSASTGVAVHSGAAPRRRHRRVPLQVRRSCRR
jgi:aquaporin Z